MAIPLIPSAGVCTVADGRCPMEQQRFVMPRWSPDESSGNIMQVALRTTIGTLNGIARSTYCQRNRRAFFDSMADLFGSPKRWVPAEHIQTVLDVVCEAEHHFSLAHQKRAAPHTNTAFPQTYTSVYQARLIRCLDTPLHGAQQENVGIANLENAVALLAQPCDMDERNHFVDCCQYCKAEYPNALRWAKLVQRIQWPRLSA